MPTIPIILALLGFCCFIAVLALVAHATRKPKPRPFTDELRTRSPVKRRHYARGGRARHVSIETYEVPTEEALIDAIAHRTVNAAVGSLSDRERALINGHYYKDRRFDHVCAELGISKSWGSRIHKAALRKLKKRCARLGDSP